MKHNTFAKIGLLFTTIAALAGCDPKVTPLTSEEFATVVDQIAKTVPLVVEKSTGTPVYTNIYREAIGKENEVPTLIEGNDLILIESGHFKYENDEELIYLYTDYEVSWSYIGEGDDTSPYAKFQFVRDDNGVLNAIPGYPTYKPEYDANDKPIHVVPSPKAGRLYATITADDFSARLSIDLVLGAIEEIEFYSLLALRELPSNTLVGIRGYVVGIHEDSNSAGIMDGRWGYGLYRLDSDFKGVVSKGDLVEVVGKTSTYNGLAQIQWIKKVKILDPTKFPEIQKPITQEFTHDQLATQLSLPSTDLTGPLQDKDNSLVKFNKPFKFLRVEDRNKKDVGFDGFNIEGNDHTNVILQGEKDNGDKFEVILSINYHMGADNQKAFKNFLEANQDKSFYYEGPLSQYNGLVLGPYEWNTNETTTALTLAA